MDHGTVMIKVPQQNSPALLVSTTHNTSDLLSAATLKNVGQTALSACRMGWVVVLSSGSDEVHLGVPINIDEGVEPAATWDVPAQSVSPDYAGQGAKAVAFFVAEVYPSSGSPWKADLVQIRQQARSMALQVTR
jgi:hypothetical protein